MATKEGKVGLKDTRISPSGLNLLITEYITHQLSKISEKNPLNTINSDMYHFSRRLGQNIMLRVSDGPMTRTLDQSAVLKLIHDEFWRFIFGRKGENPNSQGPSHVFFIDRDIELWTRVSGVKGEKEQQYVELVRILISGLIEGAITLVGYRSNVKVKFSGVETKIEVHCF
jgi:hypothetical protein